MKKTVSILGAHFSIAGGLHEAINEAMRYDCNALQIFTKNSRSWKERTVSDEEVGIFIKTGLKAGIKCIASHTSYLINLAATDRENQTLSGKALEMELIRSSCLHIPVVVLHPGSHLGDGRKKGIERISGNINRILEKVYNLRTCLLLETTSGQGSGVGGSFDQLMEIIENIDLKEAIGVCLDTCHVFAAGYDIRTREAYLESMNAFDKTIGFARLFLIHMNDSKKDLGSKVDRHEHIGKGKIGIDAFRFIMKDKRLAGIPKIIETPKSGGKKDWDKINLNKLRGMVS